MNTPRIEIKNYHSLNTHDGIAFTCTAYVNGKKAFTCENDGNGGETMFLPIDVALYQLAKSYAESLPDVACEGFDFVAPSDLDLLIDQLIDRMEEDRQLKRLCKTQTLFRLPEDETNAWRVMKLKFDKTIQNIVLYKHPNAEIANLRFAK